MNRLLLVLASALVVGGLAGCGSSPAAYVDHNGNLRHGSGLSSSCRAALSNEWVVIGSGNQVAHSLNVPTAMEPGQYRKDTAAIRRVSQACGKHANVKILLPDT